MSRVQSAESVLVHRVKMHPMSILSILHCGFTWVLDKHLAANGDLVIPWEQRGFHSNAGCLDIVEILDAVIWQACMSW